MICFYFLGLFLFLSVNSFSQSDEECVPIPDSCLFVSRTATLNCGSVQLNDYVMEVYFTCPINNYHLVVYNRWGELLFESEDLREQWYAGNEVDGVYVWRITGIMNDNGSMVNVQRTGHITVLK